MVVLKFGGTSVASPELIDNVLDITWDQRDRAPILIASAMGKTTDALVRIGDFASEGMASQAHAEVGELRTYHEDALKIMLSGPLLEEASQQVHQLFQELSSLIRGLTLIKEVTKRSRDTLLSFGERLSTTLIYYRARERNLDTQLLDSRTFIITDENFTKANLQKESSYEAIKRNVKPQKEKILIGQGFIASSLSGATTTLGRGGSDYTATIIGAALGVEEVQIWTDVSGIMTTDPRLIERAKTIPELSYEEAAELSYFGAKVIHPSTIQPAVESGISVWVKNTHAPQSPGSKIYPGIKAKGVKAIASKKGITLINVHSSRMLNAYGFLKNIFEVFERYRCSVDLVSTSEVSVSMTIDDQTNLSDIRLDLERFAEVTIEEHKAIISLVGMDLWKDSRFITRAFSALISIPVRMISLGSSDINLGMVVPEDRLDEAVTLLHREMFEKE